MRSLCGRAALAGTSFETPRLFHQGVYTMSCVAAYTSGTHHVDLDIGGLTRSFLLKVPQYVDASDGLPALVSIHGFISNSVVFRPAAGHGSPQ